MGTNWKSDNQSSININKYRVVTINIDQASHLLLLHLTVDNGDRGSVVGKTVVGKTGMSNHWGVDGVGNGGSSGIMGLSLIGHISDIAIIVIGVVLDMLDPAIGKVDRVLAINNTSAVIVLSLLEGSSRVVISDSVGV